MTEKAGVGKAVPGATLALAVAILFLRRPDAFLQPRFSAEDGVTFFKQATEDGLAAFLVPDAGYLHLVPRLIAAAASLLPSVAAPWVYAYASLGCLLAVGAFLFSPRLTLPLRPLLVLALVCVPDLGETLLTLRTVQWPLALVFPLLFLAEPPRCRFVGALEVAAVLVVGFSTPFVVAGALLFALLWREKRDARSRALFLAAALASAAQIVAAVARYEARPYDGYEAAHWLRVLGVRLGGVLVLGPDLASRAPTALLLVLTAGFAGVPLLLLRRDPARMRILAAVGFLAALALAAGFYKTSMHPVDLSRFENGNRHFYLPQVALLWGAALLAAGRGVPARIGTLLLAVAALAALFGGGFRVAPLPDRDWNALARRIDAGERVVVPVDPPGWSFEVQVPRGGG